MDKTTNYRVGKWLPSDQEFIENWVQKLINDVADNPKELLPPVQALKDLIDNDRYINFLFTSMFDEVPKKPPYNKTPTLKPQVRNYNQMLLLINTIMTKPPEYNNTGLVGFPINAILDWPMGTIAGYVVFLNKKVNEKFKAILDYWKDYLSSLESAEILNTSPTGWLNETAIDQMLEAAYAPKGAKFYEIFKCPSEDINNHYGFTSWDHFFTRQFVDGLRRVANPDDDNIITNACESAPYRLKRNVDEKATFWIKSQPYSLIDMLANDPYTKQFVHGTVYQAFLNAISFHRWHSPVSGTIVKAYNIYGSYYSEDLFYGFLNPDGPPDDSGPNESQAYLTEVASRAIIFIEADNSKIGLMCFMAVGMAEVSSNEITVSVGQHVKKGEQLGMFHFGGSTHCLIFRKEVNIDFDLRGQTPSLNSNNIPVNSKIATVS